MKNKVRDVRKRKNMTQLELAIASKVGRSTISDIESKTHTPSLETAFAIAKALDTTVDALFIYES